MTSARGWHEEVCRRLGSIRSVEPLAGTSSRTWKVELCDRLVVVKEHRSRRAREQELHALHRAAAAVRVPAVVSSVFTRSKSVSLGAPSFPSRMLWGFTSRWTISRPCANRSASPTFMTTSIA